MEIPRVKRARIFDLVCPALLLAFAFAIAYPRWRSGIDWRDEGLLAYGAERVMHGEIPHRDFVSLQPPLSYYAAACVFELGGTSLASLRILGLCLFFLVPLLIYAVARNFLQPTLSFAAAAPACVLGIPYVYFIPLAVWQGITVSIASVLFFISAVRLACRWPAFLCGVFTALSAFLRHDQAAYTIMSILALSMALYFARDSFISKTNLKRVLFLWLTGIAIVVIPLLIVWWKIGALPDMYRQLAVFPFETYRKTSSLPFPKLSAGKTVVEHAIVILFYLPPFVQALAALFLVRSIIRRGFQTEDAVFAFFIIWSGLFFLQVMVRSDQTHLLITLPPFFLLTAFLWSMLQNALAKYRRIRVVFSAIFAVAVAAYIWILHSVVLPDVTLAKERLALPRGGVRVGQAEVITRFVRHLQTDVPPTSSILALPYQPMFYFLCERRNPTRWNYLWPGDQTTADHERLIAETELDPPALVLVSQRDQLAAFAPAVAEYIRLHYLQIDQFGDLAIYTRLDAH